PDLAIEALKGGIQDHPDRMDLYGMLALVYRDQKRLDAAKDTLVRADKLSKGESAEIQYNLGLINLELGDVASAVENAQRAYDKGYPLPGLKNKLQKLGKWPATQPAAQANAAR